MKAVLKVIPGILLFFLPFSSKGDEYIAYQTGVEDAVYYFVNYINYVPPKGYWLLLDVSQLSLPQIILLMKLGEQKSGQKPAYLFREGRDYLVFGSFSRYGDAVNLKNTLESYGVYGLEIEKVGEKEKKLFKPRLVRSPHLCRYEEYHGIEGLRRLIKKMINVAESIKDPTFNKGAFVEDAYIMLGKIEDYVEKKKKFKTDNIDPLFEEALRW